MQNFVGPRSNFLLRTTIKITSKFCDENLLKKGMRAEKMAWIRVGKGDTKEAEMRANDRV